MKQGESSVASLIPLNNSAMGREQAIEALIDRDPQGSLYRANRVLEEAVPTALSNRPNLITKEALVDQAFALSQYAIDTREKFDREFPKADTLSSPTAKELDGVTRERILLYQQTQGGATTEKPASPPENLVAGLRKVYEEKIRHLLEAVTDHAVFRGARTIESLIAAVVKLVTDPKELKRTDVRLQGLMIAILSLLPSEPDADAKRAASPPETIPSDLQVGALLALLDPGNEVLAYFGKAAAVCEERSQIQTARRLARMDLQAPVAEAPVVDEPPISQADSVDVVEDTAGTMSDDGGDSSEPHVVEEDHDAEEAEEDDDGEEENNDDDEDEEDDSDYSDDEDDDDEIFVEPEASGEVFDTDDEETGSEGLRRALAVTLTNSSTPPRTPSPEDSEAPEDNESRAEGEEESIGCKTDDDEESSLPPLPNPPGQAAVHEYLRGSTLTSISTEDSKNSAPSDLQPLLDPSNALEFGRVPKYLVIQVLLLAARKHVQASRFPQYGNKVTNEIFPSGMGSLLFPAEYTRDNGNIDQGQHAELTLQLLVAAFLLIEQRREDSIENLRKALARELRLGQGGDVSEDEESSDSGDGPSGEADDPALALAMNYIEDDVPLSSESLENKGMRRKAAAAAHELAVMIETSRKQTEVCRKDVQNLSRFLLCITKTLNQFLETRTRNFVSGWAKSGLKGIHLPTAVTEKLSGALDKLTSFPLHTGGELESTCAQELISVDIYKDSLCLWSNCLPLLHPNGCGLVTLLTSCIRAYSGAEQTSCRDITNLSELTVFPASISDGLEYRLRYLCDRLRADDLLDLLVPRPTLYSDDENPRDSEPNSEQDFSAVVCLVKNASTELGPLHDSFQKLYLALCHRCNSRVLLLDGFYASTETESGSVGPSSLKTLSTGDSLRVSSQPSKDLQFDSTKCSDSIALISGLNESAGTMPGNSSVHQRASKVWGAALATNHFSPRTGVHRWAVRLDKCERGHVFLGVATAQASTRTYVGGDRYGWGLIGTQALWHDRRKIRGDYGSSFKTGATIIITLDTDAGTLRFSSWKDSNTSGSFSLDPVSQGLFSPKKSGHVAGVVEDWGVAFEGLPLDAKLFPAVGLYQRDDRLTILQVENPSQNVGWGVHGGSRYYPLSPLISSPKAQQVSRDNDLLTWNGMRYATEVLSSTPKKPQDTEDGIEDLAVLQSLSASLCLLPPSVPVLSNRAACVLMPHLTRAILQLDNRFPRSSESGLAHFQKGKWTIRAAASTLSVADREEYVVDFSASQSGQGDLNVEGKGIGTKGKSKFGNVAITGCVNGLSLTFMERWNDPKDDSKVPDDSSSCVVSARMSLDGARFEGFYRNVREGSPGHIVGICLPEAQIGSTKPQRGAFDIDLERCRHLLCLAHNHLATILAEDVSGDFQCHEHGSKSAIGEKSVAMSILDRPTFLRVATPSVTARQFSNVGAIKSTLSLSSENFFELPADAILVGPSKTLSIASSENDHVGLLGRIGLFVSAHDKQLASKNGGFGSFRCLEPTLYDKTRHDLLSCFLYHCRYIHNIDSLSSETGTSVLENHEDLPLIWQSALKLLEDSIRKSVASDLTTSRRDSLENTCVLFSKIALFLSSLEIEDDPSQTEHSICLVLADLRSLFAAVNSEDDLKHISEAMQLKTQKAILRLTSLIETESLISSLGTRDHAVVESAFVGLPRVLGRGLGDSCRTSRSGRGRLGQIGGCLTGLSGAAHDVKDAIREKLFGLAAAIGRLVGNIVESRENEDLSSTSEMQHDSLVLVLLSVLINRIEPRDFDKFVDESAILKVLPRIFTLYRGSVFQSECDGNEEESLAIRALCRRDLSRSIMRCGLALSHIMHYHLLLGSTSHVAFKCLSPAVDLVKDELSTLVGLVERSAATSRASLTKRRLEEDLDSWAYCALHGDPNSVKPKTASSSCLKYFTKYGTTPASISLGTSTRKETSMKSQAISFSHQYLNAWLHIVALMLDSEQSLDHVAHSATWFALFLDSIRVGEGRTTNAEKVDFVLPARYRSRLLRLLFPILSIRSPSSFVVKGLLEVAGSSISVVTVSLDNDESSVSRDAVSLMRKLHSPKHPTWRAEVNRTIYSEIEEGASDHKRFGLMAFFSGDIAPLDVGSFVLLKPSEASSVSPDQPSSSSKGHPGGPSGGSAVGPVFGTIPHHVVGNGTEPLVAGLSKDGASGGVVSNIDLKNAMCEVILIERSDVRTKSESPESLPGRPITVRAIRTHLAETVQAQEVPLYLDSSVPHGEFCSRILEPSLDNYLSCTMEKDSKNEPGACQLASRECALGLLALRVSITLMSTESLLVGWRSPGYCTQILSKVLAMASPQNWANSRLATISQSVSERGLSNLPCHEARFGHLVALLRELSTRASSLENVPASLQSRLVEVAKARKSSKTPVDEADKESPLTATGSVEVTRQRDSIETGRSVSQSTGGSHSEDEDENEAATTATAHLREAAIAQMAELGLPRSWSEFALRRTGGVNIEAAVAYCLERGPEIERLLAEEHERSQPSGTSRRRASRDARQSSQLLTQLLEMGFPRRWCTEALAVTGNNVDEALTWILNNGERLSEEDEAIESGDAETGIEGEESAQDDEEDETELGDSTSDIDTDGAAESSDKSSNENENCVPDTTQSDSMGWTGSIIPLRFISGRAIVDTAKMEVSGLPSGGFSSVGTKGVLLTSGKWYYEAILETAGCLQIGWADGSFAGHCHADRGDGCGDGPSSWAFDGWRRYRWHATATEWGCRWKEGDVVGCLVDMDTRTVSFTLNGEGKSIGMGVAFTQEGFRPCGGVYACVSFNRREKLRLILGGRCSEPFKYPPAGYRGVGEAILDSVDELQSLLEHESVLDGNMAPRDVALPKKFLCDFSDGEHGHELMAWTHRYYGSDASVQLGSSRHKQNTSKLSSSLSSSDALTPACVTRHLQEQWSTEPFQDGDESSTLEFQSIAKKMRAGSCNLKDQLLGHLRTETLTIAVLLARKLILHMIIAQGENFDPRCFWGVEENRKSLDFWKCVEAVTSLRSAGWVGEAGAMALAAEALGLGISSSENSLLRGIGERHGTALATDIEDGLVLPACGATQMLTAIMIPAKETGISSPSTTACAYAEAVVCSDGGGGILAFLKHGLQSAVCNSLDLRRVIVAFVRCAVRSVSEVEYAEDFETPNENTIDSVKSKEKKTESKRGEKASSVPDARLAAFMTGLLLNRNASLAVSVSELSNEECALFEAWSIGLLSASLPWRMVCTLTTAGILQINPKALGRSANTSPTLRRYFGRLKSTASRRLWAERAAMPVVSRYAQALVELMRAVERSIPLNDLPGEFTAAWERVDVDAATPLALEDEKKVCNGSWEMREGWVSGDDGWDVWVGAVDHESIDWKVPPTSSVHRLMDGGEGPPMLRVGNTVMRGVDWDQAEYGNDDGKDLYDEEKAKREEEKRILKEDATKERNQETSGNPEGASQETRTNVDPADDSEIAVASEETEKVDPPQSDEVDKQELEAQEKPTKKARRVPSPKLPIGKVVALEHWDGVPGMGRRVRWNRTGKEGVYRFGGGGGKFDLCHVEVKTKQTKIKKRHPLPESSEQCAARHGFGVHKRFQVLLRISNESSELKGPNGDTIHVHNGILEWPDFGAGVSVACTRYADGTVQIREEKLLYGAKDSGWEARFGQPVFVPGFSVTLRSSSNNNDIHSPTWCHFETLSGKFSHTVEGLRHPRDGKRIKIQSKMTLKRSRWASRANDGSIMKQEPLPPITFDKDFHGSSLSISLDGRTVSCASSDGRVTAFGSVGFTKGVHYWEVKIEQTTDIGNVFIGVSEKPMGSGSGSSFRFDSTPRLNRWHGWGFVNFRATYASGAERVYGSHCHSGDTVGVMLDCDAGRMSFFFDGLKFGEHVLNDLGCAFENLSPFGFNIDGCGSGGAGQGSPSGFESGSATRYQSQGATRPRTLWPVVGLKNKGDRVTFSSKWSSSIGIDGTNSLNNVSLFGNVVDAYTTFSNPKGFPDWFIKESFQEYARWKEGRLVRSTTRGSGPLRMVSFGLDVDFDSSPLVCACASATLGLDCALLAGDRVKLTRSAGRILELDEEAVVLGAFQGRLYYRIVSQKSEGGSLTEGGGRAWCWDESEVVGGLPFILPSRGHDVKLSKISRFVSPGGLKVIYKQGAILRSDLEILENSGVGTIEVGTIIPRDKVLERRVNSCGVVRFRVMDNDLGEGWISARIRGGNEEPIVELINSKDDAEEHAVFTTPLQCAQEWYRNWKETCVEEAACAIKPISDEVEYRQLIWEAKLEGVTQSDFDALLVEAVNVVSNFSHDGDSVECSFSQVASAFSFALALRGHDTSVKTAQHPAMDQAVASVFADIKELPPLEVLLARVSILRAFNRRAKFALPWISMRPCQEGTALFGGLMGHGASADRAGRSGPTQSIDWVQVPSLSSKVRSLRGLLFTSVKREILHSIVEATTTPTLLSHDEFDLPREIRTVRVNRLRANRVMSGNDSTAKRKYSVLSQLYSETKAWGGATLRRGYVAKGHGGQKRAFKVKFVGEGVNDYSGPYREAFTDAVAEVLKTDAEGHGVLGVLDRTPNNASSIGEDRDCFMFSQNHRTLAPLLATEETEMSASVKNIRQSFSTLLLKRDEASREVEETLVFLGRLVGTAYRHGIAVDLPLPLTTVWKMLAEEYTTNEEKLKELDVLASRQYENKADEAPILVWQKRMLNSFAEGLSHVLPIEILCLLSGKELRDAICGNPVVDVGLLKQVVEYEGFDAGDNVIKYFWSTLEEMTNDERKQFLQFVWARNRLPMRESDFDAPFKIMKDTKNAKFADDALPSASTCFFSLSLPEYSSKEALRTKLMFAISNVATMETDFQTNNAEIAEGYRDI